MMSAVRLLLCLATAALGCLVASCATHPRSHLLEPKISYTPQRMQFQREPSAFDVLTPTELKQDWGTEMKVAIALARELDLYRAITAFKRALILMPADQKERGLQAEYSIVECYYLGGKYASAIEAFEFSQLPSVSSQFPAFGELMIILYHAYEKIGECEKGQAIMSLIEKGDPEAALDLHLFSALDAGDFPCIATFASQHPECEDFSTFTRQYCACSKSARKAQTLNALLPGAGYYYVEQKKSALTSLLLNTAFVAATYYFFDHGNWGAGLFTASLEFGWYVGGINGAGLAAKQYNQCVYQELGKELMIKNRLFPTLMLQTSF